MRPIPFVAMLFVMAAACVVIAIGGRSLGWFMGGLVLFAVGMFARRQLQREQEEGPAGARLGFVAIAIGLMVAAIGFMAWLDMSR